MTMPTLDTYFRSDLATLMTEYADALTDLFKMHDVVVFVARRAYTLYEALLTHGCIESAGKCEVFSSRALSFSTWDFSAKRVAIVDDVIIKGESMCVTCDYVRGNPLCCRGLVAASCSAESEEYAKSCGVDLLVLRHLEKSDVYELTREINDFVQGAGLTNNIDQPVIRIHLLERAALRDVMESHSWFDCTTRLQRSNGIMSATITYDANRLPYDLPLSSDELDAVLAKVRIMGREGTRSAVMLPFLVLPDLDARRIDTLYKRLIDFGLREDVARINRRCQMPVDEARNKIRVLQYFLSWQLGNAALASMAEVSGRIATNRETVLFGSIISNDVLACYLNAPSARNAELDTGEMSRFDQRDISKQVRAEYLKRDIAQRDGDNGVQRGVDRCDALRFTPLDMRKRVREVFARNEWMPSADDAASVRVATSVCLDYLIDSGILVPRLKKGNDHFARSYGSGEIERLSMLEIELFEYAICSCLVSLGWASIRCSTLNRLAVLFSRELKRESLSDANDETSVFDFVYTKEEELRASADAAPFGMELLPQILVSGGRLAWALPDSKDSLKAVAGVPSLEDYELGERKKDCVRAAVFHLVDYLSAAGEDGADELLRTLIMYGSKRYMLGVVARRLGTARFVLENTVFPAKAAKLRDGFSSVFDAAAVSRLRDVSFQLVERCEWALGSAGVRTSARAKTLAQEYLDAAACIGTKGNCLRGDLTRRVEEDSFRSDSDIEVLNEYVRDAKAYGISMMQLLDNEDKQTLPYARRLAMRGEALKLRGDALLGGSVAKAGKLLVEDRQIGAIVCSLSAESAEYERVELSFHKMAYGKIADLNLGMLVQRSSDFGAGLLVVVFACEECCPHEVVLAGERSSLNDRGRLRRLYPERMRKAVATICDSRAVSGVRAIAFCRPAEDDALENNDNLCAKLFSAKDSVIDLLEKIDVDDRTARMFDQCGTSVGIYRFDKR